jgi:uracil-DNA glycosylase family 4
MYLKPFLLLHICCAPDVTSVYERLKGLFEVTGYFYNPQIEPESEYAKRLEDVEKVSKAMGFTLIEGKKDANPWLCETRGLEDKPEKGVRCEICYRLRLEETAKLAREEGFEYFTSTLSVSPHKSFDWFKQMGDELAEKYKIKFLSEDFKKSEGFKKSLEWSTKLELYRQDYCGCLPSLVVRKKIITEHAKSFEIFADKLHMCKLCEDFLTPRVIFQGGVNRPVMIIGQAPGKREIEKGMPFSGPAGKKLWSWFDTLGYSEEQIRSVAYITAAAKCWPGLAPNGKDDARPSSLQLSNCLTYLEKEFSHARPRLLILIGSLSAKTILGKQAGMDLVGDKIEHRIFNRKVSIIVLPHPSGLNRWPNLPGNKPKLEAALQSLREELDRILP